MDKDHSSSNKKIRVGVFFGGKSAEHEVSLQSAKNVVEAIDTTKFEPVLIGIDKTGKWHTAKTEHFLESQTAPTLSAASTGDSFTLIPGGDRELISVDTPEGNSPIDVALPILHGPLGEDGTIQGFLELTGLPYVGPGVLGSAIGMDKDVMKRLLRDAGIPTTPFKVLYSHEKATVDVNAILKELGTPVFVKPANMGSSVGVSRADNAKELKQAIDTAFDYDTKLLFEAAVEGDEIECAVLGNTHPKASIIGRVIPREGDFYSYEAKYIDEHGAILEIPAAIPEELSEKAREIAVKTFQVLGCEGMSRVDMFVTKDHEILVNEINTIPGFTKISMYPKLWEATGLSYKELITELIELALERHERRSNLKTSYDL
jgi:D-alanine-D-alanine ligase